MRPHILKLFLLLVFALAFVRAGAQTQAENCEGALGDPVISEDFGSGIANPGPPLPSGITTMSYVTICPEDGDYTILNHITLEGDRPNCKPGGAWRLLTHDHTGNPNGYMMVINASRDPSEFFKKITPPVLCGETKYEFSAYIFNMISGQGGNRPNIKFTVETIDGIPIGVPHVTGEIPPSASDDDWFRASFFFTTPNNVDQVVLRMINEAPGGGGNDLIIDDINFRACGPVIRLSFNANEDNRPKDQCVNERVNYTLKQELGPGYTNPTTQWQVNSGDANGWTNIPNATGTTLNVSVFSSTAKTYQYRLAASESGNINSPTCAVFSDPLTITVNDLPVVADIPPLSVCEGDAQIITASGGVSYEWTGPGITAANKNQNPLVFNPATVADAGIYKVTVTSAGGCIASKTTMFSVNKKPEITGDFTPHAICQNKSTTLSAFSPGNVTYSWTPATGLSDPNIANPVASPADTTTYTVKVSSNADCFDTKTVTVNVLPPPEAQAPGMKKIFEGQSVTLDATAKNADIFTWSPVDYLSDPHALNPVATPPRDMTYTLVASSSYNCGVTLPSSVFIRVFNKVIIPNTFSPNADGVNDTWEIEALETYPESLLTVFNRYGQLVFKSTGYSKPWKGTYEGKLLPPGTYYYIIDLKNGTPKLTGWVLLIE